MLRLNRGNFGRRLLRRWRAFFRENWGRYALGLGIIAALTIFSVRVKENYPFSHFPMYQDPDGDDVEYYFLTDAEGNPLSSRKYAGVTAPQIKKRINSDVKEEIRQLKAAGKPAPKGNHPKLLPPEMLREIAERAVAKMRDDAKAKSQPLLPLPPGAKLKMGLIESTEKGYRESFRDITAALSRE